MRAALLAVLLAVGCRVEPAPLEEARAPLINDGRADEVFGQPDFATSVPPLSVSAVTTSRPSGVTTDGTFRNPYLFVADREAHRVLLLSPFGDGFSFSAVYGQTSVVSSLPNLGNPDPSKTSLHTPSAVAYVGALSELAGSMNWIAVADTVNHRVLVATNLFGWFPPYVAGQGGDFASAIPSRGGIHAGSLSGPTGVAFDPTVIPPRLYVADTGHHRILRFEGANYLTATTCIGQPSCTLGAENAGATVSASTLSSPGGLCGWFLTTNVGDPMRGLWVADTGNHRVLHLPSGGGPADFVIGQPDFTSNKPNAFGASGRSLRGPSAVTVDPVGNVWVADTGNHRVLRFKKGTTIPDRVLGQPTFESLAAPVTASETTLYLPGGVAFGSNGDIYVADTGGSRVLRYHVDCATDSCSDGDPCTDDFCDAFARCYHSLNVYSKECSPYSCATPQRRCNGSCDATRPCRPGFSCVNGRCVQKCAVDAQCPTGHCSDGVCCATACPGVCESCNVYGREGTCTIVGDGSAPTPPKACPGGSSGCSRACDGVHRDACSDDRKGTSCGEPLCKDGRAVLVGSCDGAGRCLADVKGCAPYTCDRAACRTRCDYDHDCVPGARCQVGVCTVTVSSGGGCGLSRPEPVGLAALALVLGLGAARRRRR